MDWFARRLLTWFDTHGRKDLPWQQNITPYRVWVSEIMLQQTQVATVIDYFNRFMTSYPTVAQLAAAQQDDVLHHWTGLGYYARARNLHKAAQQIVREHGGELPLGVDALENLPGIGRSTAGAIAAIAQEQHAAILDGNVKRVLARFHRIDGHPTQAQAQRRLWYHANTHTPARRTAAYTQAIMDLGATVCTRSKPRCLSDAGSCPLVHRCSAYADDQVEAYPQRKQAKPKPERSAHLWVLHTSDGQCLLQRRPDDGIWGGLWTPPERALDVAIDDVAASLGLSKQAIDTVDARTPFRHTFSHYHLNIHPQFVLLRQVPHQVTEREDLVWYDYVRASPALGLAKPAVTLLSQLKQELAMTEGPGRTVHCRKYNEELPGLDAPPMPGPKGEELFETVSARAWQEWQTLQTMLINEKHLNVREPEARKYLSAQREKFFDNEDVDRAEGYVPENERGG